MALVSIIRRSNIRRGRWRLPVAALFFLAIAAPAGAQRVAPEVPKVPGGTGTGGSAGVGGGAGLSPLPPGLPSAPMAVPAAPQITPVPAAPIPTAPPAAGSPAPAPIIRFRCEVEPGASSCRETPPPDGGGDGDSCDCSRDFCYKDAAGARICEKS